MSGEARDRWRKVRQEMDLQRAQSMLSAASFWPEEARRTLRLKIEAYPHLCEGESEKVLQILASDPSLRNHPYWLQAFAHVLELTERWGELVPIRLRLLEFWPDAHSSWMDLARAIEGRSGPAAAFDILREGAASVDSSFEYQSEICRVACLAGNLEAARLAAQKLHEFSACLAQVVLASDECKLLWPEYPQAKTFRDDCEADPDKHTTQKTFPEDGFL